MPRPQTRAAAFQAAGRSLKALSRPVDDGPRHRPTLGQLLALDRETRPQVGITLPLVTLTALSDVDVGLEEDPIAQAEAERFIRATLFNNVKQAEKARDLARQRMTPGTLTIHMELPDASVVLVDPTDRLSSDDVMILEELRRLAGMPAPSWLSPEAAVPLAS